MQLPDISIGGFNLKQLHSKYEEWLNAQPPAVQVAVTTLASAVQGGVMGYLMGQMSGMDPAAAAGANGALGSPLKSLSAGGPIQQAKSLSVLMGVNSGATLAVKKVRKGKDDVWGSMAGSFFSGVAYTLVNGTSTLESAITTGIAFAVFNGLFYQIGQKFKPAAAPADDEYSRARHMLQSLGLERYKNNLKHAQLTDKTIWLWNDRALSEAKIPAGPRLLILHHLDQYRSPANVLKPALPLLPAAPAVPAVKHAH